MDQYRLNHGLLLSTPSDANRSRTGMGPHEYLLAIQAAIQVVYNSYVYIYIYIFYDPYNPVFLGVDIPLRKL